MEKKRNLKQRLKVGKTIFFKDVKHAKWAILSVFAYFVLLRKFFITICPAVLITGLPCPGCGMTRALIRLFMIFILWFGIRRYILGISDTKKAWKILAMLGILMILFYIWRMLRYFPGNPPMSYYYGNVLLNLHHIIKSFLQI